MGSPGSIPGYADSSNTQRLDEKAALLLKPVSICHLINALFEIQQQDEEICPRGRFCVAEGEILP
jgi:hypothetical protein